jgi:acyl carrier protein
MSQLCTPEVVINILEEKVGIPKNTPNVEGASWDDLGVESLGLTETLAGLEQELGIELPHEKAMQTRSVQELVTLINTQI